MVAAKKTLTKKKAAKSLDALVFVDANILLDFYRLAESNVRMEFLQLLEDNLSSLILTDQVEMEFKKNRQGVLKKWLNDSKLYQSGKPPPSLLEHKLARAWVKSVDKANEAIKGLQEKVKGAIKRPNSEVVYKRLNSVFSHDGPYVLNRSKSAQSKIRRLARQRFALGYPPRKDQDTSMGDAINWEWMVECARTSKKALIIVTRDGDYGAELDGRIAFERLATARI